MQNPDLFHEKFREIAHVVPRMDYPVWHTGEKTKQLFDYLNWGLK
jgi:hypothetical protein